MGLIIDEIFLKEQLLIVSNKIVTHVYTVVRNIHATYTSYLLFHYRN